MDFKTKETFHIFWQHARKYPGAIFALSFSMLGAVIADSFGPYFYKQLFDLLSAGGSLEQLLAVVFKILIVAGIGWAFWRMASFTNNIFQPSVMRDIVNTCFKYLNDHSYNFFSNNFAGSLVKKIGRLERAF